MYRLFFFNKLSSINEENSKLILKKSNTKKIDEVSNSVYRTIANNKTLKDYLTNDAIRNMKERSRNMVRCHHSVLLILNHLHR